MKKLLLAVVSIMFATTSFAQNALVASLSHGENVSYYYGVNALQQAVAAAESGDIINLSGGSFNATDITKGITVRGAGIDSPEPTYIVNDFTINIPGDDANRFMMEGIRCTNLIYFRGAFANPYFLKCQFNRIGRWDYDVAISNIMFANCKITGDLRAAANSSYIFANCFIKDIYQQDYATITASNCIIVRERVGDIKNAQLFNCIIVSPTNSGFGLPGNTQATNCITVNFPANFNVFSDCSVKQNCLFDSKAYSDVFKTYTGEYSDTETFELTDAFISEFKGTDNQQIGLYGGLQPYSPIPSYPLISTMIVPAKTNDQGKMDVKVGISLPVE